MKKLTNTLIDTNIPKVQHFIVNNKATYATFAGKAKLNKSIVDEDRALINPHAQCLTDFDLVYANPKDIKIYAIGSLITASSPEKKSIELSNTINYTQEKSSQNMVFLDKPLEIRRKFVLFNKSKEYFDTRSIQYNLKESPVYKNFKEQVIKDLTSRNIMFYEATTEEDFGNTGFNALVKQQDITEDGLLSTKITQVILPTDE